MQLSQQIFNCTEAPDLQLQLDSDAGNRNFVAKKLAGSASPGPGRERGGAAAARRLRNGAEGQRVDLGGAGGRRGPVQFRRLPGPARATHTHTHMAAAEPGPEAEARGEAEAAAPEVAQEAEAEAEAEAAKPLEPEVAQEAVRQVEFYFSDENLPTCVGPALAAPRPALQRRAAVDADAAAPPRRDKFLMKQVAKSKAGWVHLGVIAKFNKMKALLKQNRDLRALADALRASEELVVSDDSNAVRRAKPLPETFLPEVQARTVLVENLPEATRTVAGVQELCERAGPVKMVRLSHDGAARGVQQDVPAAMAMHLNVSHKFHAVVEFAELAGAEAAVKELTDNTNWRTGLRVKPLLRKDAFAKYFKQQQQQAAAGEEAGEGGGGEGKPQPAAEPSADGADVVDNDAGGFQKVGKGRRKKKDYAAWAAATPQFRSAAQEAEGGTDPSTGEYKAGTPTLSAVGKVGRAGQPAMPDGTRGFAMGRGRRLRGPLPHFPEPPPPPALGDAGEA